MIKIMSNKVFMNKKNKNQFFMIIFLKREQFIVKIIKK